MGDKKAVVSLEWKQHNAQGDGNTRYVAASNIRDKNVHIVLYNVHFPTARVPWMIPAFLWCGIMYAFVIVRFSVTVKSTCGNANSVRSSRSRYSSQPIPTEMLDNTFTHWWQLEICDMIILMTTRRRSYAWNESNKTLKAMVTQGMLPLQTYAGNTYQTSPKHF